MVGVDNQQLQAEGTLGQTDDAGFKRRYGTTQMLLDESAISYALKSGTEDLGKYAGQHMRLSGFPVEGFRKGPATSAPRGLAKLPNQIEPGLSMGESRTLEFPGRIALRSRPVKARSAGLEPATF